MIPVTVDTLIQFTRLRPVLMLDWVSMGIAYVDFLVRRSPQRITSKQGHKHLPLELWFMILTFAQPAPQEHFRGADRRGNCDLVIPHSLGVNANGEQTLFCLLPSRSRFGQLESWHPAMLYGHYLERPHLVQISGVRNPFGDPATRQNVLVEIPVKCLMSKIKILFDELTVQDVIWCAESGNCQLCKGSRRLRVRGSQKKLLRRYFKMPFGQQDRVMRGLCPLCVGETPFWDSLQMQETGPGNGQGPLPPQEYDAWENRQLIKLGFDG
ncbi:hypothetical protein ACHAPT_008229 [Fusarium lateritium]